MAREPFKNTTAKAEDFPDRVTVDLDDKDPNNIQVVEVDDQARDERGNVQTDPDTWGDPVPDSKGKGGFQKRIDRLKAESEAQKRLREQSERERDAAIEAARAREAEVADLRQRLANNTTSLATSMKGEREARITDATRRLEQAHAEGNAAAIAQATRDLGAAQAELVAINANTPPRQQPEQQRQAPTPQPQRQTQAPNLSPDTVGWIANNPWFNKDVPRTQFAVSLHNTLEARGIMPGDPRYTQELDKGMKAMYPDHKPYRPQANDDDDEPSTTRRTNTGEKGGREDSANRLNPNPRTVELTSSQLAVAKRLGLTPQAYAKAYVEYEEKRKGA